MVLKLKVKEQAESRPGSHGPRCCPGTRVEVQGKALVLVFESDGGLERPAAAGCEIQAVAHIERPVARNPTIDRREQFLLQRDARRIGIARPIAAGVAENVGRMSM